MKSDFVKDVTTKFDLDCKGKFSCDLSLDINLLKDTECYDKFLRKVEKAD
jgi:hypothetical protein